MTKYLIAVLGFIVALLLLLFWVGGDVFLTLKSSATSGILAFGEISFSWQAVIVAGVFGTLGLIGLWSLFLWLWRLPRRVKSGVGLRRRNRALDAMEEALLAGAEGDVKKARKKAEVARNLIGSTELGRVISALSAEAAGDSDVAVEHYQAMLESEKTRATGQRGLAQNMLATGDLPGAIEQSREAYIANPEARWAFDTLFKAEVANHQWLDAEETLDTGEQRKHVEKIAARRRRAVLNTAEADRLHDAGNYGQALELAVKASGLAPEFAPAAALASKLYKIQGDHKAASKLIEKCWGHAAHPALSLSFLDLLDGESNKTRDKRLAALVKQAPDHRETKILLAEDHLRRGDAVQAWAILSPLLRKEEAPSSRLCLLAAQSEERLNNPTDARLWLQRAATAPREADWSDLDPSGESFDYTPQDWRRLVFSFGDTGELIHPRFDSRAPLRLPGVNDLREPEDVIEEEVLEPVTQPDDPGAAPVEGKDLAERLDSLLDRPKS
ncbi:MAG: heme biosynthesis HemY N-terminal domain-containing protein [Litorimonas sp.]